MIDKEILGAAAALLGVVGFVPYLRSIYRRETKPHVFSWVPWFITTAVACAGQVAENGGAGAWATATSAVFSFVIMVIALFRGERNITRADWVSFLLALATIPLWVVTEDPLASVILATMINLSAAFPTLRKSWSKPYEEDMAMYAVLSVRSALSLAALENVAVVTALFPFCQFVSNAAISATLFGRRWAGRRRLPLRGSKGG